ncbi:MAG: LysR family transcriptional regulator [Deltaproteobacteria bacterium]|nr:MAG: LysR family transcriptional regulator [Deltaproteobacteria bacterium]
MSGIQLSQINLNLLLVLDALLQTHSVGEAAQQLAVTPSAVSHNLRTLRELLDDPLLVRGTGGMTPTPRADALREPLRLALRELEDALQAESFDPATAEGLFVLAIPDFLGHLFGTRIYARLEALGSQLMLDVLPSARADNAWRLETGALTCAVGGVVPDRPGVRRLGLYREDLVVLVREAHPLARNQPTVADYGAYPHALVGLEDTYDPADTFVDLALREVGASRRIAVRQRSFFGTLHTVLATDLVTMLPRTMAAWAVLHHPVSVLASPFRPVTYREDLLWHRRFDADPAHRWFRDELVSVARAARAELLAHAEPLLPPPTDASEAASG